MHKDLLVPIDGFEGLYSIDSQSNIYSYTRKRNIKTFTSTNGYLRAYLYYQNGSGKRKEVFIHKLIAETFIDNPNNYKVVNHKDGNKLNNSLNNLEWVTKSEDQKHAIKTGLRKLHYGTELYNAKLNNNNVRYIRNNKGKISQRKLAKKFGVAQSTIWAAQSGKGWPNVT